MVSTIPLADAQLVYLGGFAVRRAAQFCGTPTLLLTTVLKLLNVSCGLNLISGTLPKLHGCSEASFRRHRHLQGKSRGLFFLISDAVPWSGRSYPKLVVIVRVPFVHRGSQRWRYPSVNTSIFK